MSKEWKDLFEKELLEQEHIRLELTQKEEALKAELPRRIDASDQAHRTLVNDFLTSIQAHEILTYVQKVVFKGQGVIQPVFTDCKFTEYHTEAVEETEYPEDGGANKTWKTKNSQRDVLGYLSGIALEATDIQLQPEWVISLFIGFTGSRVVNEFSTFSPYKNYLRESGKNIRDIRADEFFQLYPPVTYGYDRFGVALYDSHRFPSVIVDPGRLMPFVNMDHILPNWVRKVQAENISHASDSDVLAFTSKSARRERFKTEQEVLPQLKSPQVQQAAQHLAQNRVLQLVKSQYFPKS